MDNQEKEEITYEDFVEKYCNKCRMKKCEGIGTYYMVGMLSLSITSKNSLLNLHKGEKL